MAISRDQIVMELKAIKSTQMHQTATEQTKSANALSQLVSQLQTTIDLEQLISIFSKELIKLIPHKGLLYTHDEQSIQIATGLRANHSCEYSLTIEDTLLGSIKLMSRQRFSESELLLIERSIACLLYPLKNSLQYLQALRSAHTDPLTGVLNRSTLESVFQKEAALTKRNHSELSLVMLDIDFFKVINDSHGHVAGDIVLQAISKCIQDTVRESDHIFRLGGEEFAILLNNTTSDSAYLLAERLRLATEKLRIKYEESSISFTASLGLATYFDGEKIDALMHRADSALYEAKNTGRNRVVQTKG